MTTAHNNETTQLDENLDLFSEQATTTPKTKLTRKSRHSSKPTKATKIDATTSKQSSAAGKQKNDTRNKEPSQTIVASTPNTKPKPETPAETVRAAAKNSPLKLLAVRAKNSTEALFQLKQMGSNPIDYAMEKRDPALKNFALALLDLGLEFRSGDKLLHWVLAEDNRTTTEIETWDCVELAMTQAWFEEEKKKIRELKGVTYIDACAKLAKQFA